MLINIQRKADYLPKYQAFLVTMRPTIWNSYKPNMISHDLKFPVRNLYFHKKFQNHSRLTKLDQVLVCGPRMETADIQVCFAQLFPSTTTAVAATVGVGTGGCHLVAGGHIGLLQ